MRKPAIILAILSLFVFSVAVQAAGPKKSKQRIIIKDGEVITLPLSEFDMKAFEKDMEALACDLQDLEKELADIRVEIPEINVDIPEIVIPDVDVPDVQVHITDLPEIPEIHVNIPEIKLDGYEFYYHSNRLDRHERESIDRIREYTRMREDRAVKGLDEILKTERHPLLRHKAIAGLAKFVDTSDAAVDILAEVARSDDSLKLRKKALDILRDSDNPKAKKALEKLD